MTRPVSRDAKALAAERVAVSRDAESSERSAVVATALRSEDSASRLTGHMINTMSKPSEEFVATPAELAACCTYLAGCPEIGFDTEFIGEQTFIPQLCLIQVATWDRLFLIDPFTAGDLGEFWEVLVDPARVVVAHAAREEIRICQRSCSRLPHGVFDLQIAAGLVGLGYPLGHGPLVGKLLDVHLSKAETLSDWKKRR